MTGTTGSSVTIKKPFGRYHLNDVDKDITFIAAGTGIAPFVPMLVELSKNGYSGKIDVIYGAAAVENNLLERYNTFKDKLQVSIHLCVPASKDAAAYKGKTTAFLNQYLLDKTHRQRDF